MVGGLRRGLQTGFGGILRGGTRLKTTMESQRGGVRIVQSNDHSEACELLPIYFNLLDFLLHSSQTPPTWPLFFS